MLGRVIVVLAILGTLLAAGYFLGGLANVQIHGQVPSFAGIFSDVDFGTAVDLSLAGLRRRAIFVSIADDSFSFQITWLGLLVATAILLLIRLLRR